MDNNNTTHAWVDDTSTDDIVQQEINQTLGQQPVQQVPTQPTQPVQQPQQQPPQQLPSQQTSSPLGTADVDRVLQILQSASQQQQPISTNPQQTQQQTIQQTQEQQQQPANFEELNKQFQETLGVDISTAVQNMNNFNTVASQTLQQVQHAQQRYDLAQAWASEVPQGTLASEFVDARIQQTAAMYSRLPVEQQRMIDSQGARGILQLWNAIQGQSQQQQQQVQQRMVPIGRATIAQPPSQQGSNVMSLSQLANLQDDAEFDRHMALIASGQGNYVDDIGIR